MKARKVLPPLAEYRLTLKATAEIEARPTKSARDLRALILLEDYRRGLFAALGAVAA